MANNSTCGTCRFWHPDAGGNSECRLNPPQITAAPIAGLRVWPRTLSTDWCGAFQQGTPVAVGGPDALPDPAPVPVVPVIVPVADPAIPAP